MAGEEPSQLLKQDRIDAINGNAFHIQRGTLLMLPSMDGMFHKMTPSTVDSSSNISYLIYKFIIQLL